MKGKDVTSHYDGGREVRAVRVDVNAAGAGNRDEVHIFHWYCAEEHLLPHYQRSSKSGAILEAKLNRPDIWHG